MERIINRSQQEIRSVKTDFKRYLHEEIDWSERLICIKGARGVGKTTIMLQYIREQLKTDVLYISLDDIYFTENRLVDVADEFVKTGGKFLFLDEVHKYPWWSREIKNVHDTWPDLRIVFSGSSILELDKGGAELSRRAAVYNLHELSLREYLALVYQVNLPVLTLEHILKDHVDIAETVREKVSPVKVFREFLAYGSYPFIREGKRKFHQKLRGVIDLIIEDDLPAASSITYESVFKMRKLLMLISHSVPFKPNVAELARKLNTSRDYLLKFMDMLHKARLLAVLRENSAPTGYLTKPEKIYLASPPLFFALHNADQPKKGSLREAFFLQQLSKHHEVTIGKTGDFLVDQKYVFEVGGKNKSFSQISGRKNAFVAADDIEYGIKQKIPLWMFGLLY